MAAQIPRGLFTGIDDASAAIILRIQIEDINRLSEEARGSESAGETSDSSTALQILRADLKRNTSILPDRREAWRAAAEGRHEADASANRATQLSQARRLAAEIPVAFPEQPATADIIQPHAEIRSSCESGEPATAPSRAAQTPTASKTSSTLEPTPSNAAKEVGTSTSPFGCQPASTDTAP
jgi:hypothetical protein